MVNFFVLNLLPDGLKKFLLPSGGDALNAAAETPPAEYIYLISSSIRPECDINNRNRGHNRFTNR